MEVTKDGVVIQVESATTNNEGYEMKVGEEQELEFTVNPEDAVIKSVDFVSAANSIVTVVDGKAIAKSPGTTIVTADINSGSATVTWEITVTEADIENPENPGDSDDKNDGGNDSDDKNNEDDGSVDVKPNPSEKPNNNHKLPNTGGRASMPILVAAIVMIGAGIKIRKRK